MQMVSTVFLLVDVPNSRVMDTCIVVTEDVDKAEQFVIEMWGERVKPEIGVHVFRMFGEYLAKERSYY